MRRSYRGFDTFEDAQTFRRFLISHGFKSVLVSKDGNLYKVHYIEIEENHQ